MLPQISRMKHITAYIPCNKLSKGLSRSSGRGDGNETMLAPEQTHTPVPFPSLVDSDSCSLLRTMPVSVKNSHDSSLHQTPEAPLYTMVFHVTENGIIP